MSAKKDMTEYLQRLNRGVLRAVKTAMDEAPIMLSAYTGDEMHSPTKKEGLTKSKAGNLYYKLPNNTNKLRTLYGNIQRAITPDGEGNVSNVYIEGSTILVDFGIDYDAKVRAGKSTTTLLYAAYHEAKNRGKSTSRQRAFLTPAFEKFMKDKKGFNQLIQDIDTALIDLVN